ncbi:Mitochondrial-processing peptidase subunit beta [Diplonema papillatum]|nr:Mitochondrial-processing peptidase subunit beta [Diplonema papillatum]
MTKVAPAAIDKRYTGGAVRVDAGMPSAPYANHVAVGWEICGADGADVLPLRLLTEVYGQYDRFMNDMSSNWWVRFNLERQSTQHGNMPLEEVRTFFDTFSDTGMMGFFYTYQIGSERAEGWNFMVALQNEWVRYCMRMEPYKVEVGKNLLKNKLIFEHDGAEKTNAEVGKQLISRGGYTPLEQAYARINDLTTQQVSDVINHYYYDREPTMSAWGLYYVLPVYNLTRRNMYKYRY